MVPAVVGSSPIDHPDMRIALFTDTFPPQINGVANHVATLAEEFVSRGHAVCVVTVSAEKMWGGSIESSAGYSIIAVPSLPAFVAQGSRAAMPSPVLVQELRRFAPDVVHVHTPMAVGWMGMHVSRRLKIPLVGTNHTFFDIYFREAGMPQIQELSWRYVMSFYNRCTQLIAPSLSMKRAFEAHKVRMPVVRVENGIDLVRFSPSQSKEVKRELQKSLGYGAKNIIYLGRLSAEKRVDAVIEAFGQVSVHVPDAQLVIAGDGPERQSLEQMVQERGLVDKVHFAGFVRGEELTNILRASDLFVSGSQFENMPLSVLEAMACGLPVVAVRSLGMIEIVRDGTEGTLSEDASAQGLAQHMQTIISDDELRERMSLAARERSMHFSQRRMTDRIENIYNEVIALHKKKS